MKRARLGRRLADLSPAATPLVAAPSKAAASGELRLELETLASGGQLPVDPERVAEVEAFKQRDPRGYAEMVEQLDKLAGRAALAPTTNGTPERSDRP